MSAPSEQVVQAAGGIVVRDGARGREVLLIHRPKYEDWSLPKGKLDSGESHEQAALREVEEETGLRGELGRELSSTFYTDRHGRPKVVRYWAMTAPEETAFEPNREVDELRWVSPEDARELLSYDRDRELVSEATATDRDRPLAAGAAPDERPGRGEQQAEQQERQQDVARKGQ